MIDLKLSRKLFNDVYYPYLFQYDEPVEVFYGGAGSGKSVFIAQKLLIKALNDKRKILCLRKVGNSQKESCWRLVLEILSQWKISNMCKIRISDMTVELPNQSIILFRGLDDPERVKSIVGITDIWLEEASEFTVSDYLQLSLRIRAKTENLQMFLSFNPISRTNWTYQYFFSEDAKEHPFILKTTYKDNKFLPQAYIDRLEALIDTDYIYYRIYTLGEYVSLGKLIFTNWEIQEFDYKDIEGELLCGLDFGFSADPTAFIASILDEKNGKIYCFKEYLCRNKTNPEIADIIKYLGFSKSLIIADSAEPKSIEELRQEGIYRIRGAEKGKDSVKFGIQKLRQYKIIVHPSLENLKTELENYSYKKTKDGTYIDEPIDEYNHLCDALRYSLQCAKQELRTIPKSRLGL